MPSSKMKWKQVIDFFLLCHYFPFQTLSLRYALYKIALLIKLSLQYLIENFILFRCLLPHIVNLFLTEISICHSMWSLHYPHWTTHRTHMCLYLRMARKKKKSEKRRDEKEMKERMTRKDKPKILRDIMKLKYKYLHVFITISFNPSKTCSCFSFILFF